jgi:cytochrome oxidase Cu insertion factor (SCO1/SenC/PrrC family)
LCQLQPAAACGPSLNDAFNVVAEPVFIWRSQSIGFRGNQMKFTACVALIVCIFVCIFSCSVQGQDEAAPVALSVPDIEVVNQEGQHLRFSSQVVDGRIAIVTGFFTTCSSMCPITQEKLSQVAKLLGPRLGKEVVIVSVSVDAENDTPARM